MRLPPLLRLPLFHLQHRGKPSRSRARRDRHGKGTVAPEYRCSPYDAGDYPSVSREQAFAAIEERLREDLDNVINSDREYVSGQRRFNGTRVPVHILFQVLADGDDIDTFLSEYDTSVTVEQSAELIRVAKLLVEFYAYKIAFEKMDDG